MPDSTTLASPIIRDNTHFAHSFYSIHLRITLPPSIAAALSHIYLFSDKSHHAQKMSPILFPPPPRRRPRNARATL
jgi:hypothetical protein